MQRLAKLDNGKLPNAEITGSAQLNTLPKE